MTYNPSGRKDEFSYKLKAQNMRNARGQTQELEEESQKMEERLMELKFAMNRDREQREKSNNPGFWKKGQSGTLGNYATEVLNKPGKKTKVKVKVLKDEPIVPVEKKKGPPGSLSYLAQRGSAGGGGGKENRNKGNRCGQCDDKTAQVSCIECGEDYCATCFAGFHLKGALRKHRSMPVGSKGVRTPRGHLTTQGEQSGAPIRATASDPNMARPKETQSIKLTVSDIDFSMKEAMQEAVELDSSPPPYPNGSSLLHGTYDEAESAQSFQQAVKAWRTDEGETKPATAKPATQAKLITTEHGTGTDSSALLTRTWKPIEINFGSGGLTYAEKLMLKRHRRQELGKVATSSLGSHSDSAMTTGWRREHGEGMEEEEDWDVPLTAHDMNPPLSARSNDAALSSRSNDAALSSRSNDATLSSRSIDPSHRLDSRISIIELDESTPRRTVRRMEQSASYAVDDVPEDEFEQERRSQSRNSKRQKKQAFVSPTPPRSPKVTSVRRSPSSSKLKTSPPKEAAATTASDLVTEISSLTNSKRKSTVHSTLSQNSMLDIGAHQFISAKAKHTQAEVARPSSGASAKAKKSDDNRPKSRAQSRATSRAGQRPESRAKSRAEKASVFGEGNLTKTPSAAIHQVAQMVAELPQSTYVTGLGDFFTVGVRPETTERTLTPSHDRGQSDKIKVSNRLYQMAPRSWRPASTQGSEVSDDTVMLHIQDVGVRHLMEFINPKLEEGAALPQEVVSYTLTAGLTHREASTASLTPPTVSARLSARPKPTLGEPKFHTADPTAPAGRRSGRVSGRSSQQSNKQSTEQSSQQSNKQSTEQLRPPMRPPSRLTDGTDSPTPRATTPQTALPRAMTPSRPPTRSGSRSGRVSASIEYMERTPSLYLSNSPEMDGEDLSIYDNQEPAVDQDEEDAVTLGELQREMTAEAAVIGGRMSPDVPLPLMGDEEEEDEETPRPGDGNHHLVAPGDEGIDICRHLRASELMEDFEEMERRIMEEDDEEGVRALH